MFNNRLKKILIIFFIICTSTPTYGSNYGSFFSIKNNIKTIISSIPINRRLIGIVVLLMGGYAAWRYFNKKNSPNRPSSPKTDDHSPSKKQDLRDDTKAESKNINTDTLKQSASKNKMPIDDSREMPSEELNNILNDRSNELIKNKTPIENPREDNLDKILDKADNELLDKSKQSHLIEHEFQINDVVEIIDAETSIKRASIDQEIYKKIKEDHTQKLLLEKIKMMIAIMDDTPIKLYLKSVGIIRKIIDNTMRIEVMTETTTGPLYYSSYIDIEKQHVKKCSLEKIRLNKYLKKGAYVRIQLKPEFLKNKLSLNELNKDNQRQRWSEDLYDERFDSQEYYIATVNNCKKDTESMDVYLFPHWREKSMPIPLPITINKNDAEMICYG